ncbi:MAG: hypothetical protein PF508_22065 [Spirochaeta sp.]|nr:hypothetical protein [Spirochaeta sp.]
MKLQKPALAAVGMYQVVRFLVLGLYLVTWEGIVEDPVARNGLLALSAGTLVSAVLAVQLLLTRSPVLLAPLRITKLLEIAGAGLLFMTMLSGTAGFAAVTAFRGVVSVVLFADAIILLFLVLFPGKEP